MIIHLNPPIGCHYDCAKIVRRRGEVVVEETERLAPTIRCWTDPWWKDGDEIAVRYYRGPNVIHETKFVSVWAHGFSTIRLVDLFHPEELRVMAPRDGHLCVVLHQRSVAGEWWKSTRSWLVRPMGGVLTLTDDLLYPRLGQENFEYDSIDYGGLYIMPHQTYDFLSYFSTILEKPYYNYPTQIPKMFSVSEMLMFLETALGALNAHPPVTHFCFQYLGTLSSTSVDVQLKKIIVELATIEALKAQAFYWKELEFQYSDGVDIEVAKYDKVIGMLDGYKSDKLEELDRLKSPYLGKGVFVGNKLGWAAPFNASSLNSPGFPVLRFLRDSDSARDGIFTRSVNLHSTKY